AAVVSVGAVVCLIVLLRHLGHPASEPASPPAVAALTPIPERLVAAPVVPVTPPATRPAEAPPDPLPPTVPVPRCDAPDDPFADPPPPPGQPPAAVKTASRYGTTIDFVDDPQEAAKQALEQNKLLFVLHVAGNFEKDCFT